MYIKIEFIPGNMKGDPDQNLEETRLKFDRIFINCLPVDINEKVHPSQQHEGHGSGGHDEADRPEVLVDGNDSGVLSEA